MPIWSILYINVFAAIVIVNSIFWMQVKQKVALIFYQLGSGFYLVFMMIAFWKTDVMQNLSLYNLPAIIAIIGTDIYLSLWVKSKVDIMKLLPELDEQVAELARQFSVIEIAKCSALLIYAPAYVCSILVCLRILKNMFFF